MSATLPFLEERRKDPGRGFNRKKKPTSVRRNSPELYVRRTTGEQAGCESQACLSCAGAQGCNTWTLDMNVPGIGGCMHATNIGQANGELAKADPLALQRIDQQMRDGRWPSLISLDPRNREALHFVRNCWRVFYRTNRGARLYDPACIALCKHGCNMNEVEIDGEPAPVAVKEIEGFASRVAWYLNWPKML